MQTSAGDTDAYIDDTVTIENGTEFIEMTCGEGPKNEVAIFWSVLKSDQWSNIMKFYPKTPSKKILYYSGYTAEKYGISKSVNTSLVVKDINLEENGLFRCSSGGEGQGYSYITLLQVVGK